MSFVQDGDLETISTRIDWLGVNYYSSFVVRGLDAPAPRAEGARPTPWIGTEDVEIVPNGRPVTAMGWDIEPSGLTDTLVRLTRDYTDLPIYITENGSAWDDAVVDGEIHDVERIDYLEAHLAAAHDAIAAGANLQGYYAWSLMDNFEWAWGYEKRFGIVRVDYDTQKRTIKDSGKRYAEIARANAV
jgi:beta-glucosidase